MGVIVEVLWNRAEVRLAVGISLLVATFVGVLAFRRQRRWLVPFGLAVSCGLILVSTLFGILSAPGEGFAWWSQCRIEGVGGLLGRMRTPEGLGNVALFVPLGIFAMAASHNVGTALAAGLGLSLFVELIQGVTWVRDCTTGDIVFNIAGAAVGALIAWGVARLPRGRASVPRTSPKARQP